MSKYQIKHTCGHAEWAQIYGPTKDRQPKADWMAARKCAECYRAEQAAARAAQSEVAEQAAAQSGLPSMIGSEKQIAWAETIRAAMLAKLAPYESRQIEYAARLAKMEAGLEPIPAGKTPEQMAAARAELDWLGRRLPAIRGERGAKWWIDHRDTDVRTLLARPQMGEL